MKHDDAVTIAGIISDIIVSRRGQGQSLFPEGKDATPSNLGAIWINQIMKVSDEDTETATYAAIELMVSTVSAPTPSDFHGMMRKLKRDAQMAKPALPESEFAREFPEWVKGKLVSYSYSDTRAWDEQKAGADYLQRSNPHYRTYIWGELEKITPEDRERYIAEGRNYTSDDFHRIFSSLVRTV